MRIINTDTNVTVAGWVMPVGEFGFPLEGVVTVVTSGGVTTNVVIGSTDVLLLSPGAVGVVAQTGVWHFVVLGFLLSFGYLGLVAGARRIARQLSGGSVREV